MSATVPPGTSGQHTADTGIDTSVPSVARIYDYALGGKDNFQVDREAAQELLQIAPEALLFARENRAFLQRAVRFLAEECGIRQFIDNGSGLPTENNVHQIAQRYQPDSKVVYIDNDPVVLAYGRALLSDDNTTVVCSDLTDPDELLDSEELQWLIDLDEPVAVLYVSVLHCIPDEMEPQRIVSRMLERVPSGSYLLLSHIVADDDAVAAEFTKKMTERTSWGRVRKPEEVTAYFTGLELIEPGLVNVVDWRPDPQAQAWTVGDSPFGEYPADPTGGRKMWELGGIARKP